MAFAASARPIPGAVATLGVSDRVTFLRKTYAHLGGALVAFALFTAILLRGMPDVSWGFSKWALQGRWTWLAVLGMFMVVGWVAERLARSVERVAVRGARHLRTCREHLAAADVVARDDQVR